MYDTLGSDDMSDSIYIETTHSVGCDACGEVPEPPYLVIVKDEDTEVDVCMACVRRVLNTKAGKEAMSNKCDHKYVYKGIVYEVSRGRSLPGTSAKTVTYHEAYFCEKCLAQKHRALGVYGNSFENIRYNATPKGG